MDDLHTYQNCATRAHFLRGIIGMGCGVALSGCAGVPTLESARTGQSLQAVMRSTGVIAIANGGMLYRSDGSVQPIARKPQCSIIEFSHERKRGEQDVCLEDGPPVLQTIGSVTVIMGPPSDPSIQSTGSGTDFGGYIPMTTGPVYYASSSSAKPWASCAGELAIAAGTALKAAQNIMNNAATYGTAIANSAQTVLSRWQGTNVIMPIAMALEFLGLLFAALGPAELLGLLAAIGITVGAFIVLATCFGQ